MTYEREPRGQARTYSAGRRAMSDYEREPRGAARRYPMNGFGGIGPDSPNGPAGLTCDSGQVYSSSYESCVNACPGGQSYGSGQTCTPITYGAPGPGGTTTKPSGGSGSVWDGLLAGAGGLVGNLLRPQSPYPPGYYPPQGPDTTTILLVGGVGLVALYMMMKD